MNGLEIIGFAALCIIVVLIALWAVGGATFELTFTKKDK